MTQQSAVAAYQAGTLQLPAGWNPGGPMKPAPGSNGGFPIIPPGQSITEPGGGTPNPVGYAGGGNQIGGGTGDVQVVSGQENFGGGTLPDYPGSDVQATQLTGGSAGVVPASAQGYNQGHVGPAVASGPAALQPTYMQASPGGAAPLLGPQATGFLAFIRRRL